jgi:hypothetical protein
MRTGICLRPVRKMIGWDRVRWEIKEGHAVATRAPLRTNKIAFRVQYISILKFLEPSMDTPFAMPLRQRASRHELLLGTLT